MKSIYDMMGRHTYPLLREDAPLEHVERFFQVSAPAGCVAGRGRGSCSGHLGEPPEPPLPQEGQWPCRSAEPRLRAAGLTDSKAADILAVSWCLPRAPPLAPPGKLSAGGRGLG